MVRVLSPYLKWFLVVWVLWLFATHLVATAHHRYVEAACRGKLASWIPGCQSSSQGSQSAVPLYCNIPWSNSFLSSCASARGASVDAKTAIDSASSAQAGLNDVIVSVGQNYELSRELVLHESALRDLAIRVRASDLDRKEDLDRELKSLVKLTDEAGWSVTENCCSRGAAPTANVWKQVDVRLHGKGWQGHGRNYFHR